jgi:hypothetical protein
MPVQKSTKMKWDRLCWQVYLCYCCQQLQFWWIRQLACYYTTQKYTKKAMFKSSSRYRFSRGKKLTHASCIWCMTFNNWHYSHLQMICWLYIDRSMSRCSPVSIVSGYGLDNRGIGVQSPAKAKGFFLEPLCPDRFWGPPSLLSNGYRVGVLSPGLKHSQGVTLTTHLHLVPRSRIGAIPPLPQAPSWHIVGQF